MIPEAIMLADFLPLLLIPPLSNFISIGRSHNPIPYTTSIFVVFFYPINIMTSRNQCFARWNRVGAILIVIIIIFPIKAIVVCRYYFNQFSASRLNICLGKILFSESASAANESIQQLQETTMTIRKLIIFFMASSFKLLIVTLPFAVISLCIGITKPFHVGWTNF